MGIGTGPARGPIAAFSPGSIAGKQMVFRIVADLATSGPTYFFLDTVSVAVTRCSP